MSLAQISSVISNIGLQAITVTHVDEGFGDATPPATPEESQNLEERLAAALASAQLCEGFREVINGQREKILLAGNSEERAAACAKLAETLYHARYYHSSKKVCEIGTESDKNSEQLYYYMAQSRLRTEGPEEAYEPIRNGLDECHPQNASASPMLYSVTGEILAMLSHRYLNSGQNQESAMLWRTACKAFAHSLKLAGPGVEAGTASCNDLVACVSAYRGLGENSRVSQVADLLLERYPDNLLAILCFCTTTLWLKWHERYGKAATLLEQVCKDYPYNVDAHLLRAEILGFQSEGRGEQEAEYRAAIAVNPRSSAAVIGLIRVQQARAQLGEGCVDWWEASSLLAGLCSAYPRDISFQAEHANALTEALYNEQVPEADRPNAIIEADTLVRGLLECNATDGFLWELRGRLAREASFPEHAAECLMIALRTGVSTDHSELECALRSIGRPLHPKDTQYIQSALNAGTIFGRYEKTPLNPFSSPEEAERFFLEAEDPINRLEAALLDENRFMLLAERIRSLCSIIRKTSAPCTEQEEAFQELAGVLYNADLHTEALALSDIALTLYPENGSLYCRKASSLLSLSRHLEACEVAEEGLERAKDRRAGLYRFRGTAQSLLADDFLGSDSDLSASYQSAAIESRKAAIGSGPSRKDTTEDLVDKAYVASSTGDYRTAYAASRMALRKHLSAATLSCHADIIALAYSSGEFFRLSQLFRNPYTVAESLCRKAAKLEPANLVVRHQEAHYYRLQGYGNGVLNEKKLIRAEESYTRALEINPYSPLTLRRRIEVQETLGRTNWREASKNLRSACYRHPRSRDLQIEYANGLAEAVISDLVPPDMQDATVQEIGELTHILLCENPRKRSDSDTSFLWAIRAKTAEKMRDHKYAAKCWMMASLYGNWYRGFSSFDPLPRLYESLGKSGAPQADDPELRKLMEVEIRLPEEDQATAES